MCVWVRVLKRVAEMLVKCPLNRVLKSMIDELGLTVKCGACEV